MKGKTANDERDVMRRVKKCVLSPLILMFCSAAVFSQVPGDTVKQLYPTLGRLLDFDPDIGAKWEKCRESLDAAGDISNLTPKQLKLCNEVRFFDEEMMAGYWNPEWLVGCSWYCGGGPDSVTASSFLKSKSDVLTYEPQNAHDLSYKTVWVEGVGGYGAGEYLLYHFASVAPRITQIIIANGYVKSPKLWLENSRVKKLKMYIDNKPYAVLNLKDTRMEQSFSVEPIGRHAGDTDNPEQLHEMPEWTVKFEILEVYEGDKFDDTAITEIHFDGIDVHCFGKGTKILMDDGSLKNIELIEENDRIKSYDFKTKKLTSSGVKKLIAAKHTRLLKLKFGDKKEIVATDDHPFRSIKDTWVAVNPEKANKNYRQTQTVERLDAGEKIFVPEENAFIQLTSIEVMEETQIAFTPELFDGDNFIANGLLVKTETTK